MKIYKKFEELKAVSITCDVCGRGAALDDYEGQEFISVDMVAGYGSVFGDMNKVEFDMCQHCLQERLGQFVRVTPYFHGIADTE
jgi:hypothetical protein